MTAITRPAVRWHGGKWKLAKWIIAQMPPHSIYAEPFGGGASVLLQKPRLAAEVYNDLDEAVVNLFRVLQSHDTALQLRQRLELTTYSRAEFYASYNAPTDPVDFAVKTVVRSFMGFGSDSVTRQHRTGFRRRLSSTRYPALPANDWRGWPPEIPLFVERLQGVLIENTHAAKIIRAYDIPNALLYCDPPYVTSTRGVSGKPKRGYLHEMTDEDHRALATILHASKAMVMISGYPSALYEELFTDWPFLECKTLADGARPRKERMWFNPLAWATRESRQTALPLQE